MNDLLAKLQQDVAQGNFAEAQERLEAFQHIVQQTEPDVMSLSAYQRQIQAILSNCLLKQGEISGELGAVHRTKTGLSEYRRVVGLN